MRIIAVTGAVEEASTLADVVLPPDRLGVKSGDSLTYKTTEGENQRFISMTLQRRLTRKDGDLRGQQVPVAALLWMTRKIDEGRSGNVGWQRGVLGRHTSVVKLIP